MPKNWGKQIFSIGSFPEMGQKQKKRLNEGNNNGQLRIATPPRVAHAKPPGPKSFIFFKVANIFSVRKQIKTASESRKPKISFQPNKMRKKTSRPVFPLIPAL